MPALGVPVRTESRGRSPRRPARSPPRLRPRIRPSIRALRPTSVLGPRCSAVDDGRVPAQGHLTPRSVNAPYRPPASRSVSAARCNGITRGRDAWPDRRRNRGMPWSGRPRSPRQHRCSDPPPRSRPPGPLGEPGQPGCRRQLAGGHPSRACSGATWGEDPVEHVDIDVEEHPVGLAGDSVERHPHRLLYPPCLHIRHGDDRETVAVAELAIHRGIGETGDPHLGDPTVPQTVFDESPMGVPLVARGRAS